MLRKPSPNFTPKFWQNDVVCRNHLNFLFCLNGPILCVSCLHARMKGCHLSSSYSSSVFYSLMRELSFPPAIYKLTQTLLSETVLTSIQIHPVSHPHNSPDTCVCVLRDFCLMMFWWFSVLMDKTVCSDCLHKSPSLFILKCRYRLLFVCKWSCWRKVYVVLVLRGKVLSSVGSSRIL